MALEEELKMATHARRVAFVWFCFAQHVLPRNVHLIDVAIINVREILIDLNGSSDLRALGHQVLNK